MAFRYLGNKTRLTPWIVDTISATVARGARIGDPMCGTASVSAALAAAGFSVIAADSLTFPVVHATARLLIKCEPAFAAFGGYRRTLDALNRIAPHTGYFHREFSLDGCPANGLHPRGYFSPDNARRIDALRCTIKRWFHEQLITDVEHNLLLHDLILAVNSVANIAGTYGYYRSDWAKSTLTPVALQPSQLISTLGSHQVLQGNIEDLAAHLRVDACYLDPPYTKRQYAGNYHVLETIAQEDEPVAVGEGGLRDWYGAYSDFCSKRRAPAAFRRALGRLDVEHVFISYSEDGVVSSSDLEALLAEFGQSTKYLYARPRYRSNAGGRGGTVHELLYHLRPRG